MGETGAAGHVRERPIHSPGRQRWPDITGWKGLVFATAGCGGAAIFFFLLPLPFFPVFPFFKIYGTAPREKLFTRSRIYFVDLINLKCGMCVYWLLSI